MSSSPTTFSRHRNGDAPVPLNAVDLESVAGDAEDLLATPSLADVLASVDPLYLLEAEAGRYLELTQQALRANGNAVANRTLNEAAAREWREQRDVALRGIGLMVREYPGVKAVAADISRAQAVQTRRARAELLARDDGD